MDSGTHVEQPALLTTEPTRQPPYAGFIGATPSCCRSSLLLIHGMDLSSLNSDLKFFMPCKGSGERHGGKCSLDLGLPALGAPGVWGVGRVGISQSKEWETSCHLKWSLAIAEPSSFPDQGESD